MKEILNLQPLNYKKQPIDQINDLPISIEGKNFKGLSKYVFYQVDGSMSGEDFLLLQEQLKNISKKTGKVFIPLPQNIKFFKILKSDKNYESTN